MPGRSRLALAAVSEVFEAPHSTEGSPMETVVVIGASTNPERYSNKAIKMLMEYGHKPIPVAPALIEVEGIKAYAAPTDLSGPVDTVTMYVGPARQGALLDGIIGHKPKREMYNPGRENAAA